MDGICPPHCGHGIGKAPCSTSGGIYTLNTFEYMLHCHQKTYHLQGTSIASWCPPCQVRNELSVGLMWQVHPPKQIETVVAYGDLIHQIAQKKQLFVTIFSVQIATKSQLYGQNNVEIYRSPPLYPVWPSFLVKITMLLVESHFLPVKPTCFQDIPGHSRTASWNHIHHPPCSLHFKATHRQVLARGKAMARQWQWGQDLEHHKLWIWRFPKSLGYPQIIQFSWIFHYQPTIHVDPFWGSPILGNPKN